MPAIDSVIRCHVDEIDYSMFEKLRKDLTLKHKGGGDPLELFSYDRDTGAVTLPRSQAHLFRERELEDQMADGRELVIENRNEFIPRDGQEEAVQVLTRRLNQRTQNTVDFRHAVLDADCGLGKTIMGAEAAMRAGRSTVIMVHKDFLARQWRDAFHGNEKKEWAGLWPEARIGYIQRDRCDSGEDYDIVIASIQSLLKREYPKEVLSTFGTLIGDEVHRYGAHQWLHGLEQFPARRRLGLTATWWRFDGMLPVISHHICEPTYEMRRDDPGEDARVHFVRLSTYIERREYVNRWDGKVNRSKLISILAKNKGRNKYLVTLMDRALKAGRKVFVLSERRQQLVDFEELLDAHGWVGKCGYYVGGQSEEQLEEASERPCILATYQMAKEALDIPTLDTLFLGTPVVDITQSVGRLMRPSEREPVIIDPVDTGVGPCNGFYHARKKQYERLGFKLE